MVFGRSHGSTVATQKPWALGLRDQRTRIVSPCRCSTGSAATGSSSGSSPTSTREWPDDEVLAPLYPEAPDFSGATHRLTLFLVQYWGGPSTYSDERGHPRAADAPLPVPHRRDRARPLAGQHGRCRAAGDTASCSSAGSPTRKRRRSPPSCSPTSARPLSTSATTPACRSRRRATAHDVGQPRRRGSGRRQALRRHHGRRQRVARPSPPARCTACWVRTGPASRRRSRSSRATASRRPASVSVLGVDPRHATGEFYDRIGIVLQSSGIERVLTVREVLTMYRRATRTRARWPSASSSSASPSSSTSASRRCRAARSVASTWPSASSVAPSCCSSTSPPPDSIPRPAAPSWDMIRGLSAGGTTIILTSHYLDEVEQLADRVGVMVRGRLVTEGTPESLVAAAGVTVVRFPLPDGTDGSELAFLGNGIAINGGVVEASTSTPTATLHALTGWALERGHELAGLTVVRPTLEDMFLEVTERAGPRRCVTSRLLAAAGALPADPVRPHPGGAVLHARAAAADARAVQLAVRRQRRLRRHARRALAVAAVLRRVARRVHCGLGDVHQPRQHDPDPSRGRDPEALAGHAAAPTGCTSAATSARPSSSPRSVW